VFIKAGALLKYSYWDLQLRHQSVHERLLGERKVKRIAWTRRLQKKRGFHERDDLASRLKKKRTETEKRKGEQTINDNREEEKRIM